MTYSQVIPESWRRSQPERLLYPNIRLTPLRESLRHRAPQTVANTTATN